MSALVGIQNLSKKFGDFTAVAGISFAVEKGEVLGFLGPNGAGKTTTMRMVTGFLEPDGGTISVCGRDMLEDPIAGQQRLGYLPEGGPLYADMTPHGFLRFIGEIRGMEKKRLAERMEYVADKLELKEVLHQSVDTLSKGFRRRVALAQAILHDPEVLILDEPTDGLDPNQKHDVRELIASMAKDKAIIISTHILEEVEAVCSRAIIIAHGKIIADGTPGTLLEKAPHHNAITLAIRGGNVSDIKTACGRIKDVEKVEEKAGNDNALVLIPKKGRPILADVSKLIQEKSWEVEELHVEKGRLDEVFRKLTG